MEPYNCEFLAKIIVDVPLETALFSEIQSVANELISLFSRRLALFRENPEMFLKRDAGFNGTGSPRVDVFCSQDMETARCCDSYILFYVSEDGDRLELHQKDLRRLVPDVYKMFVCGKLPDKKIEVFRNEMYVCTDGDFTCGAKLLLNDIISLFIFPQLISLDFADMKFMQFASFKTFSFQSFAHFYELRDSIEKKVTRDGVKKAIVIVSLPKFPLQDVWESTIELFNSIGSLFGTGIELLLGDNTITPIPDALRLTLLLGNDTDLEATVNRQMPT